jgi:hypothetical protein
MKLLRNSKPVEISYRLINLNKENQAVSGKGCTVIGRKSRGETTSAETSICPSSRQSTLKKNIHTNNQG